MHALAVPATSPVATLNLCRNMGLSLLCHDREFSVETENFGDSIAIGNFLSQHSSSVDLAHALGCAWETSYARAGVCPSPVVAI